jgi:hypothetical protein
VGISTLFEIFMHFLFKRGGDHPVWSWPIYHQMFPDTKDTNMYGLGVVISFGHFLFMGGGGGATPYGHDLHTIWCSLTQGTRVYTQPKDGEFNGFQDTKKNPLLCPPGRSL